MLVKQETNQRLDPRRQGEKGEEDGPLPIQTEGGQCRFLAT